MVARRYHVERRLLRNDFRPFGSLSPATDRRGLVEITRHASERAELVAGAR
jgi:hypothetical protein